MARKKSQPKIDPAYQAYLEGLEILRTQPICQSLIMRIYFQRDQSSECPRDGWAIVKQSGVVHLHPSRRAEPKEWAYVIAHCAMHLGFGHFVEGKANDRAWQAACDVVVERFLASLKVGEVPHPFVPLPGGSEESLYRSFREN